jgi:hypothetical protein
MRGWLSGYVCQSIWSNIAKKGLLIMSLKYSAFKGHMGVTLVSAVHVQCLAYEVFDAPERLPSMKSRNVIRGLRVWAGLAALVLLLCGCAVGMAADIVSVGTTGKSITDHVLDVVTGKDCNLFQAAWRSDRDICEPRQTEVTTRDIKGLSGPGNSPEGWRADPSLPAAPSVIPSNPFGSGPSSDPSLAAVPSVGPGDPFGSGPSGDPGGPSGGELY